MTDIDAPLFCSFGFAALASFHQAAGSEICVNKAQAVDACLPYFYCISIFSFKFNSFVTRGLGRL